MKPGQRKLRIGDVVQLGPGVGPPLAHCFMTVIEPIASGARGDVRVVNNGGVAHLKAGWEDMEYIGRAKWIPEDD